MSGKPKIPDWQRASTDSPAASPDPAPEQEESETEPQVQAPVPTEDDILSEEGAEDVVESSELLEQAERFLEDPAIRDAPREKKVAFLEAKGVATGDIETLLGGEIAEAVESREVQDLEEVEAKSWSTTPPKPVDVPATLPQPRVELPPIVTYPEFLANTEKPPPLITTKRLATTAYVAGGVMASIYGLSKYILAPMVQNLSDSRHDFAQHTHEQLKELNERLGKAVSVDPANNTKKITDVADDVSEADSDPTELYHRDYGTQTTPNLSRRPSVTSDDPQPIVTAHETRLKIIKSHLQELESNRTGSSTSRDSLKTKVSELSTYLSEMSYHNQYYSNQGFYGGNYGASSGANDSKNDQIEAVKGDIRAVKGVFLSARNFPAGGHFAPPIPTGRVGA